MRELRYHGLIETKRRGNGATALTFLIWSEELDDAMETLSEIERIEKEENLKDAGADPSTLTDLKDTPDPSTLTDLKKGRPVKYDGQTRQIRRADPSTLTGKSVSESESESLSTTTRARGGRRSDDTPDTSAGDEPAFCLRCYMSGLGQVPADLCKTHSAKPKPQPEAQRTESRPKPPEEPAAHCLACDGSGIVTVERIRNVERCAWCDCPAGADRKFREPSFLEKLNRAFEREKARCA
jgi:hypothetical protein